MKEQHALIVGGGIVGCMTAMTLRKLGFQVTVVERNIIAAQTSGESSWAGAGIAFPLLPWFYDDIVNELALNGARLYPDVCNELFESTGIDPECIRSGMFVQPPFDLSAAKAWAQCYQMQLIEQNDGIFIPDVLQIRNPRLLQSLKAWLLLHKVTLLEKTQLKPLSEKAGDLHYWETEQGDRLTADVFVVTSGAWSFELLKETAMQLDIKPMRGQMLLYQMPVGLLPQIVYRNGFYLLQRRDGHLLAGSSLEDVGFDTGITDAMRVDMQQQAEDICPALKNQPILKHWSGLRPGTPKNIPTIGRHPHLENVYLNTGHFRYGVTMAPECARRVSQYILQAFASRN